jgi:exopolyphosphatase / guanosine-5'-triphosphate,3'-diphosphate pyrophosphatase
MERKAVIDLGTNTFNLLVADVGENGLKTIHTERIAVLIGMGGINSGIIADDAMQRAKNALALYCAKARELGAESILGFGTSALRDASNSSELLSYAASELQLTIHIISGMEEAALICNGVKWAYDFSSPAIVMDIGGGSTEFISAFESGPQKAISLNIGVSRIFQELNRPEDYSEKDVEYMQEFLNKNNSELLALKGPEILIGASGTFETFYEMLFERKYGSPSELLELPLLELNDLLDWCIHASFEERKNHPWLIDIRKSMMPIAALKVKWVIDHLDIKRVFVSPYSLKEGALNWNNF